MSVGYSRKLSFLQQCVVPEPPQGDEEEPRSLPTCTLVCQHVVRRLRSPALREMKCCRMSFGSWAGVGRGRAHEVHAAEEGTTSRGSSFLRERVERSTVC